ncbi:histidine phosphatase family protein [Bacillus suaedaesalsae]|uniref:Histidine phosphatase family protein n=1 Tax=Bacillus suaedaesalsae TaxID=2810349 RepID=A0ABS2DK74_9BACI|nr:histidine phosphatase family protein [Bacillus suaedaesalsae]MBM6618843.1 histidine phosphatase family protein [Bacillus suaedaesalsae]
MSTHIYFTRHGETVWNTQKLLQGWKDSPLTDRGINQAKRLLHRLSNIPLDAIYSSTSNRAYHTAEIIKGERNLEVIQYESLRELSFGTWEGKTFEENEKESIEDWISFWETPHLFANKTVESFVNVQERMSNTVKMIANNHPDQNVLIVTHSIALKLLIDYFEENELKDLWATPAIPSTSLTLVKFNDDQPEVVYKYDIEHLIEANRE